MKLALAFIVCFVVAGCSGNRPVVMHPWGIEPEPSAEWMLEQESRLGTVAFNETRLREGW